MKLLLKLGFYLIIAFNLFLASWYVLNGDIQFPSDVGRNLYLLEELDQKKIVLIGSKSSTNLFHGPTWTYLNYPAYLIGQGDPLVVGWYWIFLIVIFVVTSYFIAKDLFNREVAYLFTLMISVYMVFHANNMFNPDGALLFMPAFFYTFIKYLKTEKFKFLISHLIVAALVLEFQMAIGIPLMILSVLFIAFRTSKKKHIISFILIPFLLSNFIIFDFRHGHLLFNILGTFLSPQVNGQTFDYLLYLPKRIQLMLGGIEILREDPGYRNLGLFLLTLFLIYLQIKNNKYKLEYFAFLYFYFGFFVLSLINKGDILYFHFWPIFPMVFLIFSSLITFKYKKIFLAVFMILFLFNQATAISNMQLASEVFIGKDITSWKFLKNMSSAVFGSGEKNFGYFVYAPDTVAYEQHYAADYSNKIYKANAYRSQKKTVTYLIIAPPPPNNSYMKEDWWIVNKVHINKSPVSVTKFDNGYKVNKYLLTDEEIKVKPEPDVDLKLFFR